MRCPRDGAELKSWEAWKPPRHQCPKCHGILIVEKDVMEAIVRIRPRASVEERLSNLFPTRPACPRDGTAMCTVEHKGILLALIVVLNAAYSFAATGPTGGIILGILFGVLYLAPTGSGAGQTRRRDIQP